MMMFVQLLMCLKDSDGGLSLNVDEESKFYSMYMSKSQVWAFLVVCSE